MCGGEKTTGTTVVNQTTTPTPTAEERALNQLELERTQASQQGQIGVQAAGLDLMNKLLRGNEPLPGFFQELSQGISEDMTQDIVKKSLQDIMPQFQTSGIMDSGTAASISARTAGDIRRATAEYNQNNKFNLLNLALSGQAQIQSPLLAQSAELGSRLAGLRSVNTQGTTNQTTIGMNPFLKSFQTSLGSGLGSLPGKIGASFMGV